MRPTRLGVQWCQVPLPLLVSSLFLAEGLSGSGRLIGLVSASGRRLPLTVRSKDMEGEGSTVWQ